MDHSFGRTTTVRSKVVGVSAGVKGSQTCKISMTNRRKIKNDAHERDRIKTSLETC